MSHTDARNITTTFRYDGLNRLIQKSTPNTQVVYTYDVNIKGVLSQLSDHNSTVNYRYDSEKRLILTERDIDGKTSSVAYNYDVDGNINEITYPSGNIIRYGRGLSGRVDSVKLNNNNLINNILLLFK